MNQRMGWKGAHYQDKGGSQAASKAFNIKVELNFLNTEYDLEVFPESNITKQGLLFIGKIKPRQPSLPEYLLRWDEKNNHLNVDMIPEENFWKSETQGYKGHLPEKAVDHVGRAFSIVITTPKLRIIDGVVSFSLARDVAASVSTGSSVTASAEKKSKPHNA